MKKHTVIAAALAVAFGLPLHASAADDKELAAIRAQIVQMKQDYEARLQALEQRLQAAQTSAQAAQTSAQAASAQATAAQQAVAAQAAAPAPMPAAAPAEPAPTVQANANAFNPNISLILGGTFSNLSQNPSAYRLQGFMPTGSDDVGPGKRSFSLGESELTLASNIDPMFAGQLTFSVHGDNTLSVEESFVQTRELSNGLNLKFGRFLSSIGYINSQHAHAWDFVDAPLAYQALFGGQYKPEGVQLKWLAPVNQFLEIGAEVGNGAAFPGSDRNKNGFGAGSLFAHLGDDIGDSGSYRVGLSWLHSGAQDRSYDDTDPFRRAADGSYAPVTNTFSGRSNVLIADAIYKWAPNGNPTQQNFKLQGEYLRRSEVGTLAYDVLSQARGAASGSYDATQSGWYLQGVYQFEPNWRVGLRYDRLSSGSPSIGLVNSGLLPLSSLPVLAAYSPSRSSVMIDYSPGEFSRMRLQLARDQTRPGVTDNEIYLQYIMSLGTHAAHSF